MLIFCFSYIFVCWGPVTSRDYNKEKNNSNVDQMKQQNKDINNLRSENASSTPCNNQMYSCKMINQDLGFEFQYHSHKL